ncbi:MAG: branched-chain amino acid ABC transporter permease [Oceanospirillales bacterium]|uniref:Amino acid/amide ABC transporter membrane protein 2 (HAAT family) n=1 Tax=Marinobacterium halophilum TaxID=267374 RepID=A0A2P8ETT1_9GAMM|nr:branched-chain amino acid ABC transporter permease [Marinobacterium halophilum]MBR9829469.1 branched-chain amino acid ABC transporter permease [Oceanospirillales bacterium]PSL12890.1 amino acid/amide ABC transporter membrane protein 2 (HAAT family) [Marinobacterium halophilum]
MLFNKRTERYFIWVFFPLALLMPLFLAENTFFVSKLTSVMIFALFVMSLDYLVGRCGLITLGHAMFYGLGGYLFWMIAPEYEAVNFWVYTFYICTIAAAVALVIGFLVLRTSGIYMIMITLAFAQMAFYFFSDSIEFGGNDGLFIYVKPETSIFGLSFFDLDNPIHFYYLCLLSLFNTLVFFRVLIRSRFGRVVDAINENPGRTTALGYNIFMYRLMSYVIASALGAYAGYLFTLQYGFVNPSMMAWTTSGSALVMSILGGMGSIYGAILGTFAYEGLHYLLEHLTEYWMLFMGILIIAMVMIFKNGIAGYMEKLLEKRI